jgi:hypothetical protein
LAATANAQSQPVIQAASQIELASSTAQHGGVLRNIGNRQAETVLGPGGIKLYLYTSAGDLISTTGAKGVVTLAVSGNTKQYRYNMYPGADGALAASVDLTKIVGRQVELSFQTIGLSAGPGAGEISFRELTIVPEDEQQKVAAAIAQQKLCPVTGKLLGSMGQPVSVTVKGQEVFVCCAGCVDAVTADPLKFAGGRPQITVTSATTADAALIKRQGNCPVMDEPLGSMGQPIKVLVGKQPIFLCCKGCIKKVQAEPAKYLAMVHVADHTALKKDGAKAAGGQPSHGPAGAAIDRKVTGQEVRPGVFRVTKADAAYVAAQKRCPVMDEPLDAMGGPYRVEASGKAIYICCPGCAKKIFAQPETFLGILAKQGVKPPVLR